MKLSALHPYRHGLFVLILFCISSVIGFHVYKNLTRIREALPAQVLQHQYDVLNVLNDLVHLVRVAELARIEPSYLERTSEAVAAANSRLENVRQVYSFEFLFGAAAMHAIVYPALQDIQRWSADGIYDYPPDSSLVRHLLWLRANDMYVQVKALVESANQRAAAAIASETEQLMLARASTIWYIAAFAFFACAVVMLLVYQYQAQVRLVSLRQRLSDSIEIIDEGFALFDHNDKLILCNKTYQALFALSGKTALGSRHAVLVEDIVNNGLVERIGDEKEALASAWLRQHKEPGPPYEIQTVDGRIIRVSERITQEGGRVAVYTEITDMKRTQNLLEHMATHDALTGLAGRGLFQDHLVQALARAREDHFIVAVMFIDLDHFKGVNDTFGHAIGDSLLKTMAKALRLCFRKSDTIARMGGDEFAVLLENVPDREQISRFAERTNAALNHSLEGEESITRVTASIGIALFPQDGESFETLLHKADLACYHAKNLGRDNHQFFDTAMESVIQFPLKNLGKLQ